MNMTEAIQTYLNDPKIVSVNTVDAHSDHKYFESLEEFSEGEMKLRQSLNGKWKIHYAQNTNQVLKDFYKTEFDETDLNFINVPGHLELQGFGSPQYVKSARPSISFTLSPSAKNSSQVFGTSRLFSSKNVLL